MRALLCLLLCVLAVGGLLAVPVVVRAERLQGARARAHFPRPRYL